MRQARTLARLTRPLGSERWREREQVFHEMTLQWGILRGETGGKESLPLEL